MCNSPFDRPYSPGEVELDSTSLGQSQAVSPRTLVEPALRVTIPKVTWPSAMSRHSSVKMRSPQTLEDRGAQDLLRLALEAHSSREAADDQAVQETSGEHTLLSRAPSEEWDGEEQLNSLRESMPIFVDSGETAGLPSTRDSAQKNSKDAWQLVRTYTMGVRTRKNASRKAQRVVADQEKEEDQENSRKAENKDSYFVRMVRDRNESMGADPTAMGFNTSPNANRSGGGILSSLMALQQQNQSASGTTTPGGSIISSRASSVTSHSSDSEDEEGERAKFTYQQREKRRRGAWSNVASNVASGVTKSLGLAGAKPVSATLEIPRSARRPLPQTPLSPPLATPERPRSLFSTSRPSSPTPSEGGSFTAPLSSRPVSVSGMSSASKLNKHGFSLHLKDLVRTVPCFCDHRIADGLSFHLASPFAVQITQWPIFKSEYTNGRRPQFQRRLFHGSKRIDRGTRRARVGEGETEAEESEREAEVGSNLYRCARRRDPQSPGLYHETWTGVYDVWSPIAST